MDRAVIEGTFNVIGFRKLEFLHVPTMLIGPSFSGRLPRSLRRLQLNDDSALLETHQMLSSDALRFIEEYLSERSYGDPDDLKNIEIFLDENSSEWTEASNIKFREIGQRFGIQILVH